MVIGALWWRQNVMVSKHILVLPTQTFSQISDHQTSIYVSISFPLLSCDHFRSRLSGTSLTLFLTACSVMPTLLLHCIHEFPLWSSSSPPPLPGRSIFNILCLITELILQTSIPDLSTHVFFE